MLSFEHILQKIESKINQLSFDDPPQGLYDPIKYILALGGKRIRPALALMACNLYHEEVDRALIPAIGMEVFHNFTLLHDDLMDNADKRRGKPTAHKVWNANTAILSGDAMLIESYRLIGQTAPECLKEILDIFTRTALDICRGQQYDMEFEVRSQVEEPEYMEMIRLKTAVLLACCLQTGAILGGALPQDADLLYGFGIHIGLAFQLRDDLLDVYGNPAVFGKAIGGDILCNKKTFLSTQALIRADGRQKEILGHWLNVSSCPEEKIRAVTEIYNELDVKNLAETRIQDCYDTAMKHLAGLRVQPERLTVLREVCNNLMHRNV